MFDEKNEIHKINSRAISSETKNIGAKSSIKHTPTSKTSRLISKAFTPKNISSNHGTINSNYSNNMQDLNSPNYEPIRNEKLFSLFNNNGKYN